jgi:hypothetical protein
MHAYLITGGTEEERQKEILARLTDLKIHPSDCIYCQSDTEKIGISEIRNLTKRIIFAPNQSPFTAGIIFEAHRLTVEAQNALLKLLEEPPPRALIFCETYQKDMLLQTVVSRCQEVGLHAQTEKAPAGTEQSLQNLLQSSTGQRLVFLDSVSKERAIAKDWTLTAIKDLRKHILNNAGQKNSSETKKNIRLIRMLTKAYAELEGNINPKLALDTVFLSI